VSYGDIAVVLLADHPDLIHPAGVMRWVEWGDDDPSPAEWIAVTAREAGRDDLPVTLVALDRSRSAVGVVGLNAFDDALTDGERAGRTPWLVGLVVDRDARHQRIGHRLVRAVEDLARHHGRDRLWVVTGSDAVGFYRACGWVDVEQFVTTQEQLPSTVLTRALPKSLPE
jgi:GNAT superfamily N-acetyltransferase